ncbi:MAG: nicotinamide-nucleotide adenylyltransferase [Candidatus Helarchaeota archaeon]
MVRRGVFIGRFQPIHMGHIKAIKEILNHIDEVIIVIGSAQVSHSFNNPFTAGERVSFIKSALKENNIDPDRYFLIPVSDTYDNRLWVAHLVSLTPSFELVYSNNPLVKRLLFESGYTVKEIPLFQREKYSGTIIRIAILEGKSWEDLVPSSVAELIKKFGGEDRIKSIGDTKLKQ